MYKDSPNINTTQQIKITGLVQGVGFRPFIYILAQKFKLSGWVENRNDGVLIKVNTDNKTVKEFITQIKKQAPVASSIEKIELSEPDFEIFDSFCIKKSESTSNAVTEISPDIAVCDACLDDLDKQKHRINYPLINCTNCGPRFTIIQDLPYDREKTTMSEFEMCDTCKKEYTDIYDRRFHAQPVACNNCGPKYKMIIGDEKIEKIDLIIEKLSEFVEEGKLTAIKGTGGYNLMCDAFNDQATEKLRLIKKRESKPFAIMFSDLEVVKKYMFLSKEEEKQLCSWRKPVVLLDTKIPLSPAVSNGLKTTGVMLPYMPFHYLLFRKLKTPAIVLTSGNLTDEPIVTQNQEAVKLFSGKVDAIVSYNRKIHNRTDDSVGIVINDKLRLIRRSRAYAPSPVHTNLNTEGIFAAGAEYVNCFCIGKGNQAIMSQHIGDLKNLETYNFYTESYNLYTKLFRFKPKFIVCDMHPDYLSTGFANEIKAANTNAKIIKVQHHHAHIASCMAEYKLDEKVIGISFDGVGLGDDGNIWGGEFFVNDLKEYKRITHFEYVKIAGGDMVSKEPWRSAVSYLYQFFGKDIFNTLDSFSDITDIEKINVYIKLLNNNINTYKISSAGRLFDAVSALAGIVHNSGFHAEAPMRLESFADSDCRSSYSFTAKETISFKKTFKEIIEDINTGITKEEISAKFHNTIVNVIICVSEKIKSEYGLNKVVLSGGTFQNKYILEKAEKELENRGFMVFSPTKIPVNDGGIALGQLAVAAKIISVCVKSRLCKFV